jgi:hypothetical protein
LPILRCLLLAPFLILRKSLLLDSRQLVGPLLHHGQYRYRFLFLLSPSRSFCFPPQVCLFSCSRSRDVAGWSFVTEYGYNISIPGFGKRIVSVFSGNALQGFHAYSRSTGQDVCLFTRIGGAELPVAALRLHQESSMSISNSQTISYGRNLRHTLSPGPMLPALRAKLWYIGILALSMLPNTSNSLAEALG